MKDRPHLQEELQKLDRCRDYLKEEGIWTKMGYMNKYKNYEGRIIKKVE
jgi:hypothetical protein